VSSSKSLPPPSIRHTSITIIMPPKRRGKRKGAGSAAVAAVEQRYQELSVALADALERLQTSEVENQRLKDERVSHEKDLQRLADFHHDEMHLMKHDVAVVHEEYELHKLEKERFAGRVAQADAGAATLREGEL